MSPKNQQGPGKVRIIGGQWRGRRILLPDRDAVRPTADRIRETLFNWSALLPGARCLDLFAGSGALGAEALSRDAAEVVFVEKDPKIANSLRETLNGFGSKGHRVVAADAIRFLDGVAEPFDIIFVDPPFAGFDLAQLCRLLDDGWLAPGGRVYLEMPRSQALPEVSERWELLREKTAGQVRYALLGY